MRKAATILLIAVCWGGCIENPPSAQGSDASDVSMNDDMTGDGGDPDQGPTDGGGAVDVASDLSGDLTSDVAFDLSSDAEVGIDVGRDADAADAADSDMATPSRLVTSVQTIQATISEPDGTATVPLPTTIDSSVAVPFMSLRTTGNFVEDTAVDIVLNDSQVVLSRDGNLGDVTAVVTVVEFDPNEVKVEPGSFSDVGALSLGDTFDPPSSFVIHAYDVDREDDARADAFVSAKFTAADELTFSTQGTNAFSGHYWAVQSRMGNFQVRHLEGEMASGTAEILLTVDPPVDPNRSFLIQSTTVEEPNMKADKGHVSCVLATGDTVTCVRETGDKTVGRIVVQVVELAAGSVRRGTLSLTDGVHTQDATIDAVSAERAHAWCGVTGAHGAYRSTEDTDGWARSAYATCELTMTGDAVVARRAADAQGELTAEWQVIEWP